MLFKFGLEFFNPALNFSHIFVHHAWNSVLSHRTTLVTEHEGSPVSAQKPSTRPYVEPVHTVKQFLHHLCKSECIIGPVILLNGNCYFLLPIYNAFIIFVFHNCRREAVLIFWGWS